MAQRQQLAKLSPWLRHIVRNSELSSTVPSARVSPEGEHIGLSSRLHAFVRLTTDDCQVLDEHGCYLLASFGDIHIVSIPLDQLLALTFDSRVLCIEASPSNHILTDSMSIHLNATPAYVGLGLPQAFTGRGVVMGVMDVGFDLTHPTFYSRDTADYRIRCLWDQLSTDTVGSPFPVGRDYVGKEALLKLGHSRDGLDLTHGTHTLGIAAGSGYDSPYRGMAPEADICIVANAVSDDIVYIDSADIYKYTFATDALGFKYIFDYAQSVGQPCVISFSEGSPQDFYGYDQLFYAMLDSLTGPGRILVAAAGNEGHKKNWMRKLPTCPRVGTFLRSSSPEMTVLLKSADDYFIRIVTYSAEPDTLLIPARQVLLQPDSTLTITSPIYGVELAAYPSCYNPSDICYDLTITSQGTIGVDPHLSVELLGDDADVEMWRMEGTFEVYDENPLLNDGDNTHNIHSPSSAPCVISVGATTYRDHITNLKGEQKSYWPGKDGNRVAFSSVGPTFDGRIKPDCMAPGNNIISSYSSYYLENHPTAGDVSWDVAHFLFRGRTYAWNSNSGTSMSAPAVGGAIALWLQACPTLSPSDVLGILKRTCQRPSTLVDVPDNEYGYGEVNVYAGLLDILGLNTIDVIPREHTNARISIDSPQMHIELSDAALTPLPLCVYNLKGQCLVMDTMPQGIIQHDVLLPRMSAGIYVVSVGNTSTLVRLAE